MTTQRESATVEGRISWLEGAYIQVNERLGDLIRGQEAIRDQITALVRKQEFLSSSQGSLSSELAALREGIATLVARQDELRAEFVALMSKQEAIRAEIAALSKRLDDQSHKQDTMHAEMNSRFNGQLIFMGAMWATMVGGFISLAVAIAVS